MIIGYLPILDHLIPGVAAHNDRELFERLGLATKRFNNWDEIAEALKTGEIDSAFLLFPLALKLFREGLASKVLLLGHREGQSLVVRNEVKTISDLRDKTIFVPHQYSTHYILLQKVLAEEGLSMKDVKLEIGHGEITATVEKFKEGKIDGVIIAEPISTEIIKTGKAHTLVLSNDIEEHHADCIFIARQDLIDVSREAISAVIDSFVRAGGFINAYPRQASEIGSEFLGWPKDLLLEALTHDKGHILFWDLLPRLEDFENLQKIAVHDLKLWDDEIDLSNFIYPEFAQTAYRDWVIDVRKQAKDRGAARMLPGNFSDSIVLLENTINENLPVFGIKYIHSGQKYPVKVKRELIPEDISALLRHLRSNNEIVFETSKENTKGIYFFNNRDITEPDQVFFQLTQEGVEQCMKALSFGKTNGYKIEKLSVNNLISNEPILFATENGNIWGRLNYDIFRFLGLLLSHFSKIE